MWATMPLVLKWVLGGHTDRLDRAISGKMVQDKGRVLRTTVEKYPNIDEAKFARYLEDDDALLRASNAQWLLVRVEEIDQDDIYFLKAGKVLGKEPVKFGPGAGV